jgi:hypothetical protein
MSMRSPAASATRRRRGLTAAAVVVAAVLAAALAAPLLTDDSNVGEDAVPRSTGTTPLPGDPTTCGELRADVPDDLTQRTQVEETVEAGPAGRRVTFNETSLTREVSLITGSEPLTFDHGVPAGARRSETAFRSHPAVRVDLPSGDRYVYWQDDSRDSGCEGFQIVTVGLSEQEHDAVLASVDTP